MIMSDTNHHGYINISIEYIITYAFMLNFRPALTHPDSNRALLLTHSQVRTILL